jgi:DNA recombination protein RmuC
MVTVNSGALALLAVGLLLGFILGVLWERGRSQSSGGAALDRSTRQLLDLADNQFAQVGKPIHESLRHLDDRLREIEHGRASSQAALAQQIEDVRVAGQELRGQTAALVTALRAPQVRGRWGELHLRRAVELAGMVDRCDFDEQVVVGGAAEDGVSRPDLIVHLAGDKHVVVDAKVPLGAFLEAAEAQDEAMRADRLKAHARQLKAHVDQLGSRAYWKRLSAAGTPTPEFVLLFVPGESFLSHALEADPELLEYAATRRVMLATPITLITLLRTVAYAWSQDTLAAEARTIIELGRELYDRVGVLAGHVDRVGASLGAAVSSYNKAVGSLDARVLVTARRLNDLGIGDAVPETPRHLDTAPRSPAAMDAPDLAGPYHTAVIPAATRSGADRITPHER